VSLVVHIRRLGVTHERAPFRAKRHCRLRLRRQLGGPARPVGVGKRFDADHPPITDGQERGSGLIDFELVRPADDVHDDRNLITGVVEPQRLNPVPLSS
jgi:hypothetical protein